MPQPVILPRLTVPCSSGCRLQLGHPPPEIKAFSTFGRSRILSGGVHCWSRAVARFCFENGKSVPRGAQPLTSEDNSKQIAEATTIAPTASASRLSQARTGRQAAVKTGRSSAKPRGRRVSKKVDDLQGPDSTTDPAAAPTYHPTRNLHSPIAGSQGANQSDFQQAPIQKVPPTSADLMPANELTEEQQGVHQATLMPADPESLPIPGIGAASTRRRVQRAQTVDGASSRSRAPMAGQSVSLPTDSRSVDAAQKISGSSAEAGLVKPAASAKQVTNTPAAVPSLGDNTASSSFIINGINTASRVRVPGSIGKDIERRIMEARPFEDWDDLKRRVAKVGDARVRVLQNAGYTISGRTD